jgi:hypothetical protein
MNANVDFIGHNASEGQMASYIHGGRLDVGRLRPWLGEDGKVYIAVYKGGDPKKKENYRAVQINRDELKTHATLRRDEWKQLDEAVLAISETRLSGIQDLISNGLVFTLGNAMGTTVLEWHDLSDAMEASLTMDGVTRSVGDRPAYGTNYLPLPIIHVDYEINARVLAASRSLGNPLDVTSAERAARKVNEKLEQMLFTATSYTFGGGTIYSYLNHPDRNTGSLGTSWATDTGANILTDVYNMKQASINAYHYGPWMLYIPMTYETAMDKDYDSTTPGTTVRERILKVDGIKGVKVIDTLTDGNVLLVQMTTDVVRLVQGMAIQNVEWGTEGNLITKYKVMTIQVPQIRSDQAGNSGVVHYS